MPHCGVELCALVSWYSTAIALKPCALREGARRPFFLSYGRGTVQPRNIVYSMWCRAMPQLGAQARAYTPYLVLSPRPKNASHRNQLMYLVVGRRLLRVSSRCERTSGCRALSKPLPLVHPHIAVPRAGLRLPPFDRGLLASPCSSFSKCCYLGVEYLLQGGYMASKVPALSVNSAMLPAGIGNYCRRSMFRTWQLAAGRERSWRVEG